MNIIEHFAKTIANQANENRTRVSERNMGVSEVK